MNAPPVSVPVDRDLDKLAPRFAEAIRSILRDMTALHERPAMVSEALRTDARQRYLYGFGRDYDDGRGIVTHSQDADESWHGYGLAADIIDAARAWNAPPAFWDALGMVAEANGCTWGGRWRMRDLPHVQWGRCRVSPSPRAARLVAEGGLDALWREVGAL